MCYRDRAFFVFVGVMGYFVFNVVFWFVCVCVIRVTFLSYKVGDYMMEVKFIIKIFFS